LINTLVLLVLVSDLLLYLAVVLIEDVLLDWRWIALYLDSGLMYDVLWPWLHWSLHLAE
jgi:hypothetical protein